MKEQDPAHLRRLLACWKIEFRSQSKHSGDDICLLCMTNEALGLERQCRDPESASALPGG